MSSTVFMTSLSCRVTDLTSGLMRFIELITGTWNSPKVVFISGQFDRGARGKQFPDRYRMFVEQLNNA